MKITVLSHVDATEAPKKDAGFTPELKTFVTQAELKAAGVKEVAAKTRGTYGSVVFMTTAENHAVVVSGNGDDLNVGDTIDPRAWHSLPFRGVVELCCLD